MWQKARYIKNDERPWLVGQERWVFCAEPMFITSTDLATLKELPAARCVVINVTPRYEGDVIAQIDSLELLPEFRDDEPPMIPWERHAYASEQSAAPDSKR